MNSKVLTPEQVLLRMKEILINEGANEEVIGNMTQEELDNWCMENGCMLCCI